MPPSDLLPSFGLSSYEAYSQWWNAHHFTNNHVSDGPRFDWVFRQLPAERHARVLEVGCQTGGFTVPLLVSPKSYDVTAVDIVPANLEQIQQFAAANGMTGRLTALCAFAEDLPYAEEFDTVLLCEVLIHCIDERRVMDRVHQAAKVGGTVVVTVPYRDLFKGVELSRYYDLDAFTELLCNYTQEPEIVALSNAIGVHALCSAYTKER